MVLSTKYNSVYFSPVKKILLEYSSVALLGFIVNRNNYTMHLSDLKKNNLILIDMKSSILPRQKCKHILHINSITQLALVLKTISDELQCYEKFITNQN